MIYVVDINLKRFRNFKKEHLEINYKEGNGSECYRADIVGLTQIIRPNLAHDYPVLCPIFEKVTVNGVKTIQIVGKRLNFGEKVLEKKTQEIRLKNQSKLGVRSSGMLTE